jgi:radical SAM superfamily enzyme YgiQ (UPF0313 family)
VLASLDQTRPGLSAEEIARDFPPLGSKIKALLVWPRFPPSFWGFESMMEILPEKAVMPPLGLITLAALLPTEWRIRLLDRSVDDLTDEDMLWADVVMVSAMHAQRADTRSVLSRAHALNRRTMIGGPWASSEPELLLQDADHVVVGEVENAFSMIAADLESGRARRLYRVMDKPSPTVSPIPRFDLLHLERYASMSVQFSRGCPFQCEFCDIITIYGREPRTKTPSQLIAELEVLHRLGWRKQVFIVDDNFIGNHRRALELSRELAQWQRLRNYPFSFYTEASIDLAERGELIDAMVEANFLYVFIGIETPSPKSLKEARKFQNLRRDNFNQIRFIQRRGLWVTGGFIVGFDSDDSDIFSRQIEFIERAAIPWAMTGVLQAPPTTPLFERMRRDGRLLAASDATSNFSPPNFVTVLPLQELLAGLRRILLELYAPDHFFPRALRSLQCWRPRHPQRPPPATLGYMLRVVLGSLWHQGIRSDYRRDYWRFLALLLRNSRREPARLWLGFVVLLSAHHFLHYSQRTAKELARNEPSPPIGDPVIEFMKGDHATHAPAWDPRETS